MKQGLEKTNISKSQTSLESFLILNPFITITLPQICLIIVPKNCMVLINFEKSKIITFFRVSRTFEIDYSIDFPILERVDTIRDLGIIYDSSLSFDQQNKTVVNKCLKILEFIRKVTLNFQNVSTLIHLYKSLCVVPSDR